MKFMLWLIPALVLSAGALAQDEQKDPEKDQKTVEELTEESPAALRQRLAEFPEVFDQDWYQVEVLIFARKNPATDEYWRLGQHPEIAANVIRLARGESGQPGMPGQARELYAEALEHNAWRTLDEDQQVLNEASNRMQRTGRYRILFHQSWRQPITKENRSFPVYVQGGDRVMPRLDEAFRQPASSGEDSGGSSEGSSAPENNPAAPETATGDQPLAGATLAMPELRGTLLIHVSRYLHIDPDLWFTDKDARGRRYHVQIDRPRRMRSEELHYLDHPKFGLMVQVNPFKTEEQKEMERIEEALEKQMEQ